MTTETETIVLEPEIIPTRKPYTLWDDSMKEKVLRFARQHGRHMALMAKVAGISPNVLRQRLKEDQSFQDDLDAVLEERNVELETEARRRAMEGVTRRKYDKDGRLLEEEQVFSDTLMVKLLEADNPQKFGRQRDQGVGAIAGGVLLIPVKMEGERSSDPESLAKRLEDLSAFQDDLRREAEKE
jgi:hypothetical protein